MKWLAYNLVAVCFIILAGLILYWGKEGWGWCVFAAVITTVLPSGRNNDNNDNE